MTFANFLFQESLDIARTGIRIQNFLIVFQIDCFGNSWWVGWRQGLDWIEMNDRQLHKVHQSPILHCHSGEGAEENTNIVTSLSSLLFTSSFGW